MTTGHLKCPEFKTPHFFFSREDGVSTGIYEGLNCGPGSDDDPANVDENRRIAAGLLAGRRSEPMVSLYQEHGINIVHVTDDSYLERPKGDGMVANNPGIILGILTADCTPVLFEDTEAGVVGAAHAGWQGALKGVLENTISAMEKLGATRAGIKAAIGPTIAQPSYEVGTDFKGRFLSADKGYSRFFAAGRDENHFQFDLPGFVSHQLREAGIKNIWNAEVDTYASDNHFSYRRTTHNKEPDYGRQLSAIMLQP